MSILKDYYQKYPALLATLFFTGLTFLFTLPLGINFSSRIPGGGGDTFQALSNIDLHLSALEGLGFFAGAKLFLSSLGTYSPYVFLNLFLNKYAAYNTMFFLSYVLSGLGAYLLAYHFTKKRSASLIAGVIFAFAPFHYYQTVAVHLGSMQQQWIPFAALFLVRFMDKLKFGDYAMFLSFLFMLAISEHQLLAFSLLFLLTIVFVKIWQNKELIKNKKLWIYLGGSLFFFAVIAFFVFGDLLNVATSGNNFLDPGSGAAKKYAMKPWEPVLPPHFHAIWPSINDWLRNTVKIVADSRDSYFIGFSGLISVVIFFWLSLRKKERLILEKMANKNLNLWLVTFFVTYIFSWGPGLKVFNFDLPLPYYFVYEYLPFYENIRVTGRLFMFAMLSFAMLVAFAVKYLQPRIKEGFWKKSFSLIFIVVIMLEFWVGPIRTISLAYSSFYDDIAKKPEVFKILEIPGSTDYEFASYKLFTNNVHGKQSLDGMALARKNSGQFDFQQETPIIKQLLYTIPKGNDPLTKDMSDILKEFDWNQATDILNYHNVGYVTLSKIYAKEKVQKLTENFVQKNIAYSERFEDEHLVAYRIKKQIPTGFYSQLMNKNEQFSDTFKSVGGTLQREVGNGAQIKIVNMETSAKKITITINAQAPASLNFNVSGVGIVAQKTHIVDDKIGKYVFEMMLAPGENIVAFEVSDQNGNPVSVRDKKKDSKRALIVSEIIINAK